MLGLFYFSFPENLRTLVKIGYIQLFATLPFLYFHSWIPYADLPFAAYLFGAVLAFIGFLKAKNQPFLVLSALFMSLAIWTKNEGFAVVLPVILAVSLLLVVTRKWKIRHFIWYWLITAFIASPWLVFRFVNKLELLSGDSSSFKLVFNWQFLGEWFSSVFLRSHFNFLYLLVFLLLILKAKAVWSNLILRYLSLILILLFLFYNGIIIFTDKAYDLGALTRVNLQIAPIAMLLLLLLLKQIFYDALWFVKKKYDQTTQD